jgi:hypothetical protein|tara:strand:+ start:21964 stop:22425 length:462 start_codon:yes stop_codon:yes gene_type:complete
VTDLDFENKAELHKHFSTHCFNEAWKLMENNDRTPEETEEMVHFAMASLFHWSKREDCTDRYKSIGCWQVSRCYALSGNLEQAERYGKLCLEFSENEGPFYLGYAHEALARVHGLNGNTDLKDEHLQMAKELCHQIKDKEEKELLEADLSNII